MVRLRVARVIVRLGDESFLGPLAPLEHGATKTTPTLVVRSNIRNERKCELASHLRLVFREVSCPQSRLLLIPRNPWSFRMTGHVEDETHLGSLHLGCPTN